MSKITQLMLHTRLFDKCKFFMFMLENVSEEGKHIDMEGKMLWVNEQVFIVDSKILGLEL